MTTTTFGLPEARPLALVGEVSLTVNGVGSSELYPQMAGGTAAKKNKWTENLLLVFPSIVCPLKFIFCGQRPQASFGAVRLSGCCESLNFSLTNAKGMSSGGLVK